MPTPSSSAVPRQRRDQHMCLASRASGPYIPATTPLSPHSSALAVNPWPFILFVPPRVQPEVVVSGVQMRPELTDGFTGFAADGLVKGPRCANRETALMLPIVIIPGGETISSCADAGGRLPNR